MRCIIFLILTSCGSGHGFVECQGGGEIVIHASPEHGSSGYTEYNRDCASVVYIGTATETNFVSALIAHELFHSVGFKHHNEYGCASAPVSRSSLFLPPCASELEQMQKTSGTFVVYASDWTMAAYAREAMRWWNFHCRREVFVWGG